MKIIVDIDNTLCVHRNRDYKNAIPINEVIDKVNCLHDDGVEVCLYTSRGMNSCNGDLRLIKENNEKILIDWLERNNVMYDSIIFGKPLADYYIDDGGMSVEQFLNFDFKKLDGNSGSSVIKFGKTVVKEAGNANFQFYWYEDFEKKGFSVCEVPSNRLLTLNTIKMDFIDGELLCNRFSFDSLFKLLYQVYQFKSFSSDKKCVCAYLEECKECYESVLFDKVIDFLKKNELFLISQSSFCHGDLSFGNVIVKNDKVFLIDPNDKAYSSYLLDLAKMRCSIDGLEMIIGPKESYVPIFARDIFDCYVKNYFMQDLDIVVALEITRFVRILPYMKKLGKKEEEDAIVRVVERLCKELIKE